MVDIASISAVVAATSVVAGVLYYSYQIRNQTKARQTDILMRLFATFSTKEFQEANLEVFALEFEDYNDFENIYGHFDSKKPIHIAISMVAQFFEALGVLVHRNLVDIGLVTDLYAVGPRWEILKPIVEERRKQLNVPELLEWFEYLNDETQKRGQQLATQ